MKTETRFIQVWTSDAANVRTEKLSDRMALGLLQDQYGETTGAQFFVNLARGVAKCASVGNSMVKFHGKPLA